MSRRPIEHTRREGTIKWPPTVGPEENHELGSNGVTLVTRHPDFRRSETGFPLDFSKEATPAFP
jgi:hypothetical protein